MAVRTISTKLVVDGEAEYKQAITACNAQLSLLKSGLAATASEFRNNANSLAALTAKDEKLNELKAAQAEKIQKLKDAFAWSQSSQRSPASPGVESSVSRRVRPHRAPIRM